MAKGLLLYMNQEGRGIGLLNKLKTYQLQDKDGHSGNQPETGFWYG